MNQPEPRKASEATRAEVLQALKNEDYFIYDNGISFLEQIGFDSERVIKHLIEYLQEGKALYLLPDNPSKCQCCLRYEGHLVIHSKLAPKTKSDGCFVCVAFHRHDTGYSPLPE